MLSTNPFDTAIQNFDYHPSVKLIKDNITLSDMFPFESVSLDYILKEITNLISAKNFKNIRTRCRNIRTRCLKEVVDICCLIVTQI